MIWGIDISSHNGDIDLTPWKDGGFVIIRAGYGIEHKDSRLAANVAKCKKLGIAYGVYWYSYALNAEQALREAKYCYELTKTYDIKMGVWFDMEDADSYKKKHGFSFSKSEISKICKTFCDYFKAKGYYTGIYCSYSWLSYLNDTVKSYPRWVAHWGSNDGKVHVTTKDKGPMLQYTSKLRGSLDGDLSYYDVDHYKNPKDKDSTPATPSTPSKSVDDLAWDVLMGKYGNGEARRRMLGANYAAVQKRVNQIIKLAKDTMNGKYGNGATRKKKLGNDYSIVQKYINYLMK